MVIIPWNQVLCYDELVMPVPESVTVKIKRADQHIADLNRAIDQFWTTHPYKVSGYVDSEGRPTYQITDTQPIAPIIPTIAGDAIQCLRAALDRIACALWSRTGSGNCAIYFPITESAAKYKSEGLGKVKGIGQDAIDAITAIEPYQGGKGDALWRLHCLAIIDRHRMPLAVIGGQLGVDLISLYKDRIPELAESFSFVYHAANFRVPLKNGDIIFVDEPNAELHKNLKVSWFVFFNEPGIFECKPIIPSLKALRDFVDNIVNQLAALL